MAAAKFYGVLDLARAPHLYEHVARLEPEAAECLFAGRLAPEVRRASPFLVELEPADPLSKLWRGQGWGGAWGILLSSRQGLPVVRRRLRHFTMAKLPDGSGPMLFRFWDPRVLRTYLPLAEHNALADWFKDIDLYILETEDGKGSIRYSFKNGNLVSTVGPAPTG